jgi:hypothetical protein
MRFDRRRATLPIALLGLLLLLMTLQFSGPPAHAAAQSTETPTPAPPVLIPKLGRVPITAQNAAQIAQLMQIGNGGTTGVCWSPDGGTLGVTTTIGLSLYDTQAWSKAPRRLGSPADLTGCSWSPHSRYITVTSAQKSNSASWSTAIWKVADGTLFKSFDDANGVTWSSDGRYFASLDTNKQMRVWDGVNGQLVTRLDRKMRNGHRMVSSSRLSTTAVCFGYGPLLPIRSSLPIRRDGAPLPGRRTTNG